MARGASSGSGKYSAYNKRKKAVKKYADKVDKSTDEFLSSFAKKQ